VASEPKTTAALEEGGETETTASPNDDSTGSHITGAALTGSSNSKSSGLPNKLAPFFLATFTWSHVKELVAKILKQPYLLPWFVMGSVFAWMEKRTVYYSKRWDVTATTKSYLCRNIQANIAYGWGYYPINFFRMVLASWFTVVFIWYIFVQRRVVNLNILGMDSNTPDDNGQEASIEDATTSCHSPSALLQQIQNFFIIFILPGLTITNMKVVLYFAHLCTVCVLDEHILFNISAVTPFVKRVLTCGSMVTPFYYIFNSGVVQRQVARVSNYSLNERSRNTDIAKKKKTSEVGRKDAVCNRSSTTTASITGRSTIMSILDRVKPKTTQTLPGVLFFASYLVLSVVYLVGLLSLKCEYHYSLCNSLASDTRQIGSNTTNITIRDSEDNFKPFALRLFDSYQKQVIENSGSENRENRDGSSDNKVINHNDKLAANRILVIVDPVTLAGRSSSYEDYYHPPSIIYKLELLLIFLFFASSFYDVGIFYASRPGDLFKFWAAVVLFGPGLGCYACLLLNGCLYLWSGIAKVRGWFYGWIFPYQFLVPSPVSSWFCGVYLSEGGRCRIGTKIFGYIGVWMESLAGFCILFAVFGNFAKNRILQGSSNEVAHSNSSSGSTESVTDGIFGILPFLGMILATGMHIFIFVFGIGPYRWNVVHLFWGWCAWWNSVLYACTSIDTQFKVSQSEGPHHQNLNHSVTNYTSNNNNFFAVVVENDNLFTTWSILFYIGIFGMAIPIIGCFSPLFLGKVLGGYRMASFHFVGNEQAQCFLISKKVVKKIYRCWLKENFGDDGKPLLSKDHLQMSEENASTISELPYLVRLLLVKKFGYVQLEKKIEALNEKTNASKSHVRHETILQKQGETILDCSDNCSKTAPLLSRKQENFTQNNHNKAAAADSASEKVKPTSVWQKTATKNVVDIMLDDYTITNDSDYTAFPLFADGLDLDLYLRLYTKTYCDVDGPNETNEKSAELKVSKHDIFSGNKNNTAFEELNKDYIFFTLNWLNIVGPLLNTKWDETLSSIVERYRDIVLDTMDVYDQCCESEILSIATKSKTRSDDCQPGDFREDKKIRLLSGPAVGRYDESSEKAEKLTTAISTAAQETTVQQGQCQQNEIVTSWIVQSGSSIPKKWTRPVEYNTLKHQEPVELLSVISLPIPLFECKKKWNICCNRVTDEDSDREISASGHVIQFESNRFPWQIMDQEFDEAWSKKTMATTK